MEKSGSHLNEEAENNWKSKLIGIFLAYLSAFVLLAQNTVLQKMNLHFNDALLLRAFLQTLLGLILVLVRGQSVWIKDVDADKNIHTMRMLLFAYGVFGALFNATDLIAVYFMPLGDAMTIIMSSVLPTTVLAAIFLKERLRLYKSFCVIWVIIGLVLVIRPPFLFVEENIPRSKLYYIGALSGLICMISSASFRIVMKILVNNKSTSSFGIPLLYTSVCILIIALILPAFGGDQKILFSSVKTENYDTWQWIGLFATAILGITQHSTRFMAIKLISPVLVSFIRTSEIIVAYIIQITITGTRPYVTSLIGSGFVIIACIGVILESWLLKILNPNIPWLF